MSAGLRGLVFQPLSNLSPCSILPAPQFHEPSGYTQASIVDDIPVYEPRKPDTKHIPPYGKRAGWIPRSQEDFADGGAYPEIHVAQYPLNMGRKNTGGSQSTSQEGQIISLSTDTDGSVNYDAVVKQGHAKGVIVHTKNSATKEKFFDSEELVRPTEEEEDETAKKTLELLQQKMNKKASETNPAAKAAPEKAKYIRYTPANQTGASARCVLL